MGLAGRVVFHMASLPVKGTCCPLCRECFLSVWLSRAQHAAWAYSRCSANVCWELTACSHSGKFFFFLNVHFTDGEMGTRTQCWWWLSWGCPRSWFPGWSLPLPFTLYKALKHAWILQESVLDRLFWTSGNIPEGMQESYHWTRRQAQRLESTNWGHKFCNASPQRRY